MATQVNDHLVSWADDLDANTTRQAMDTARLPIIAGHVALMPDAHYGYGATVGSVIPTEGAIIPSAVGVDLGCGMSAVRTDLTASDLPDDLSGLLDLISEAVPSGVGVGHGGRDVRGDVMRRLASRREHQAANFNHRNVPHTPLEGKLGSKAHGQYGSLGSGNHFVEVSLDGDDNVWVVLHSGSRGVGNMLAQRHINLAKDAFAELLEELGHAPDEFPTDLAWLVENTPEFDAYVTDMLWAQEWALGNRDVMLDAVVRVFESFLGRDIEAVDTVKSHHNFAARETHDGKEVWVTRKGAVRARVGDRGIIPGSMGTATYIVSGKGAEASWCSSSHGAGRVMSRTKAKKSISAEQLTEMMAGRTWLSDKAQALVDEAPAAYKDIDHVMDLQHDLVTVDARLDAILNYKGA